MVYRILRIQLAAIGIFCAFISARVDTLPVQYRPVLHLLSIATLRRTLSLCFVLFGTTCCSVCSYFVYELHGLALG